MAHANNLRNIDVQIPIGRLSVITGVSGSGKSSFLHSVLMPAAVENAASKHPKAQKQLWSKIAGFDQIAAVYEVDQSPIGKTSRSCPATYVGVLDDIRKLFAQVPTATTRGYCESFFNTEGGRCETCGGNGGIIKVDHSATTRASRMDALPPRSILIQRQHRQHAEQDITRLLNPSPHDHRTIAATPARPGSADFQLGQPSPTLSGGEAQRLKLVTATAIRPGQTAMNERAASRPTSAISTSSRSRPSACTSPTSRASSISSIASSTKATPSS